MKNLSRQIDAGTAAAIGNAGPERCSQQGSEMRVLVMQDGPAVTRLKEWLWRYEFNIVAELSSHQHLARRVGEMLPDVLIVDTPSPNQQMLDQLRKIRQNLPRPVLIFSRDGRNETIKAAIRCGVTSYLVGNVNFDRLPVIIRVAIARFEEERDRRKELDELRSELTQYKVIGGAVAIIMNVKHCSEDAAHRSLREIAASRGLPIGEIAKRVVEMSALLKY